MGKNRIKRQPRIPSLKGRQLSLVQTKKEWEGKSLLAKKDQKTYGKIIESNLLAFNQDFLRAKGDSDKIHKAKKEARTRLMKELKRSIPGVENLLKSKLNPPAEFVRFRELQKNILGNTNIDTSLETAPAGLLDYRVFEPPFALGISGEATPWFLDDYTDGHLTRNSSTLEPSGFMSLNFDAKHDSTPVIPFVSWGFYSMLLSAGTDYTIPQTGYLNITAVARNLYNQVLISILDKAGLSVSEMNISHEIGLLIVRSGEFYFYPQVIFKDGLINHGGLDQVHLLPGFPTHIPHFLNLTTSDAFLKGETVQIRFYSRLSYSYKTVCMTNYVLARLNWKLDKLYLKMT
ncbi:MAG TPA: hypothetical protein PKM27_02645 [Saprospiraceae bacterium]|nr:hypothetical protein [Saprospiraceae bacterium]HNT20068.1 hypothetical protein [Saprospiraceae bacterium]